MYHCCTGFIGIEAENKTDCDSCVQWYITCVCDWPRHKTLSECVISISPTTLPLSEKKNWRCCFSVFVLVSYVLFDLLCLLWLLFVNCSTSSNAAGNCLLLDGTTLLEMRSFHINETKLASSTAACKCCKPLLAAELSSMLNKDAARKNAFSSCF